MGDNLNRFKHLGGEEHIFSRSDFFLSDKYEHIIYYDTIHSKQYLKEFHCDSCFYVADVFYWVFFFLILKFVQLLFCASLLRKAVWYLKYSSVLLWTLKKKKKKKKGK